MPDLKHLFLTGEFRRRAEILVGLTLEQVNDRPAGASHSIYEELWHTVACQRSVLERSDPTGDAYPSVALQHEEEWARLVAEFLDGAGSAVALGERPDRLALEVAPGETMADELAYLAVHNAYHPGKIVALRQRIGAWPPPGIPT